MKSVPLHQHVAAAADHVQSIVLAAYFSRRLRAQLRNLPRDSPVVEGGLLPDRCPHCSTVLEQRVTECPMCQLPTSWIS